MHHAVAAPRALLLLILVLLAGCARVGIDDGPAPTAATADCFDLAWTPRWVQPGVYEAVRALTVAPEGHTVFHLDPEFDRFVATWYDNDGADSPLAGTAAFEAQALDPAVHPARLSHATWLGRIDGQVRGVFYVQAERGGLDALQESGLPPDHRILRVRGDVAPQVDLATIRAWFDGFLAYTTAPEAEHAVDFVRFLNGKTNVPPAEPNEHGFTVADHRQVVLVRPTDYGRALDDALLGAEASVEPGRPGRVALAAGDWTFHLEVHPLIITTDGYSRKTAGWHLMVDGADQVRLEMNRPNRVGAEDYQGFVADLERMLGLPLTHVPAAADLGHRRAESC